MFTKAWKYLVLPVAGVLLLTVNCAAAQLPLANQATATPQSKKEAPVIKLQHWRTAAGIPVTFVQTASPSMIDLEVVFHAGAAYDGEKEGLALLTGSLLDEGTSNLTPDQIAQKFDDVGAIYHVNVNRDMAVVGLRSLSDATFFTPALQNFIQVLTVPSFPLDSFNRVKNQMLVGLEQELQSPGDIAKKTFYRALYGNQPYGHTVTGTTESVSKLTQEDVQQFYKKYYTAKNALLTMVGNMTVEQAKLVSEQVTKNLVAGAAIAPLAMATPSNLAVNKTVDFPSQQTTVLLGDIGITPRSADYFPLQVGNYILGGGTLVSRLFDQVREKHGLVYGISSQFVPLLASGPFVIFLQTRNDEAQKAIKLTQELLKDFIQTGPSDEELIAAKKNIIGGFPLAFDSNSDIIEQITYLSFYDLPDNYFDTYRDNVSAVTKAQIIAAFQKHINPDSLVLVTVGEAAAIENHASPQAAN